MKTLQIIVLGVSLLGLTSCAHHHGAKKSCCTKDSKSCDMKDKKTCSAKKNCDGKNCDLDKKKS